MSIEIFSLKLQEFVQSEEVSKRGLSKKLEVNRSTILNWRRGKYYPHYDTLIKLVDYFRASTDFLLV